MPRPKKRAPEGLTVTRPSMKDQTQEVLEEIEAILGDGRTGSIVWARDPNKLAQLSRYGIGVVYWEDLSPQQQKAIQRILPFKGTQGYLMSGTDDVFVFGNPDAWERRQNDKRAFSHDQQAAQERSHSAVQIARETGLQVDETFVDLPPGSALR